MASRPVTVPEFVEPMKVKSAKSVPMGDCFSKLSLTGTGRWHCAAATKHAFYQEIEKTSVKGSWPSLKRSRLSMLKTSFWTARLWPSTTWAAHHSSPCNHSGWDPKSRPSSSTCSTFCTSTAGDLRALPIEKRKARLEALLAKAPAKIRYSVSFVEHIDELLKRARGLQLEGLIGKRFGSRYQAGKRSGAWIKLKLRLEQEVVIGGYTESGNSILARSL